MIFLKEYIKLRTELGRELSHLELDQNLQYVSNPWNPDRKFKEGMVVYYGDTSTGGTGSLTWFKAKVDSGPSPIFDISQWDAIGANGISGTIFVKDKNNVIQSVSTVKFDSTFDVVFNGDLATITVDGSALGKWLDSPSDTGTIYYEDNVLIGIDTPISSTYKLTVAGNQFITGSLVVSGLINGINLVNLYNDYIIHSHTLVPNTLTNYTSLYPDANGSLSDVNIDTGTLATGQVLTWDNTTKRWINTSLTTGPHTLGSHTDVAPAVSIAPVNNQILRYNSGTSKWENITLALNGDTGFATAPFSHNHDTRYWTKSQLAAITGPIIEWGNIFNAPTIPPVNASYVVTSLTGSLTNERAITAGTGISFVDNGGNNTLVVSVSPATTNQLIAVELNDVLIGTRSTINFIEPISGLINYTIVDDSFNNRIEVTFDLDPSAIPVTSVNTFTGDVSLGIAELDDVVIVPAFFPGIGVGSPYNPLSNILVYDDDIAKWTNIPASALLAAISNIYLDDILDVEIGITDLQDKALLYFDSFSNLWINGSANDANIYTISDLQGGALNTLYYTKTELQTAGLATVDWLNIVNEPAFAPAAHSHYLYQIVDVKNYFSTPPNNGDILVWNTTFQYWEPVANTGGSGFSTVINNYSTIGTYTSAIDVTITPSNLIPLKFQADNGILLETDSVDNIVKIGVAVDGVTVGFNTQGELGVMVDGSVDTCFEYTFATLTAGVPETIPHGLATKNLIITIYDENDYIIDIDTLVTTTNVTLESAVNLTNVRLVALKCVDSVILGTPIDTFGDLVSSTPTDGNFLDGIFPWTTSTKIVDAFDDINELLASVVPSVLTDWIVTTSNDLEMAVSGNVLPYADDINDLGTQSQRWRNIYLGSRIDFKTDLEFYYNDTNLVARLDSDAIVLNTGIAIESLVGTTSILLDGSDNIIYFNGGALAKYNTDPTIHPEWDNLSIPTKQYVDDLVGGGGTGGGGSIPVDATGIDTYTGNAVTGYGPIISYDQSVIYLVTFANNNTGASTLNIDGVGTLNILKGDPDSGLIPLVADDIQTAIVYYLVYDGTQFQFFDDDPTSSPGTYTNLNPTTQTVGGVTAGTTFNNVLYSGIFDILFYPYLQPTFSAFAISGQATTLEVGATLAGGPRTFTWTTTIPANVAINTIKINNITGGGTILTGSPNDGIQSISISPVTKVTATSHKWRIYGTRTNSSIFTKDFTVNWRWRMFYGTSALTTLAEADIEGLLNTPLAAAFDGTYSFATGGYKYFCIPNSFGFPDLFRDFSTNLAVAMAGPTEGFTLTSGNGIYYQTVSVTNVNSVTTTYRVYRSKYSLGGAIQIIVT